MSSSNGTNACRTWHSSHTHFMPDTLEGLGAPQDPATNVTVKACKLQPGKHCLPIHSSGKQEEFSWCYAGALAQDG
jgi:hypothetical protein